MISSHSGRGGDGSGREGVRQGGREADKPAGVRCAALMRSLLFSSGVPLTLQGTGETREGMSKALVKLTMWQAGVSSSERHLVCPRIRSFNPKSNHP